jgi:hypothetical protein
VLTDETDALNTVLVALAGTVKVGGTVTTALLLDRFTLSPPLGAAEFSVTVQESVPDPVIDALLQEREIAFSTGVPVPVRLITEVPPVDALLVRVSWPVTAPAAVGLNCTFRVIAWPGFRVTG